MARLSVPAPVVRVGQAISPAWNHPRFGWVLRAVVLYVGLIEVALQLLFGRLRLPFIPIVSLVFGVDVSVFSIGRYSAPIPPEVIANGMVLGSLYSLVAVGLILVYRGNRIINFAQAQLGAVPAVVALLLIAKRGVPYMAVLPIVVIGAAILGAGTEITLVRRFANAPRLILTVVTIGVGILLVVMEFFAKQWVGGDLIDTLAFDYNSPVSNFTYRWGVQTFKGDHLMTVVIVAIVVLALGAFFKFTDMGIAVRASAENGERASLLGIPVKRVSTVVWALAAVLSSIGIFLRGPLVGINLTGNTGLSVLLFGLAIAVMARMDSMPLAFGSGLLIGAINEGVIFSTNRAALTNAVMFAVILAALLIQRGALSRAMELGASSWQTVREYRTVPAELRGLREVVVGRRILTFVVAAIAVSAPWIFGDARTPEATLIIIYAIVGVSLVVLTGWTGQISLGQYAISGVASGVSGMLATSHGWDFFAVVFTGGMVGALVAVLVGLPALRIQGLFLAVTTLGFAFAVEGFILKREFFPWMLPEQGAFIARPLLYGSVDLSGDSELFGVTVPADAKFYWLCLVVLGLAVALARGLRKNRSGRILIGARDNGRLVQAFGVNLAATRLAAFAVSGFIAGLAGALIAYQNEGFEPGGFTPEKSLTLFVMAVIGGVGSIPGAILGAVFVVGLPLLPGLRGVELIDLLTSSVGLLFLLMFLPGGLIEGVYKLRDGFLRWVAAKHGLHVPSLVADSLVTEEEEGMLLDDREELDKTLEAPIPDAVLEPAGAR
jgi:branched-chain amino acid transport system permease protein